MAWQNLEGHDDLVEQFRRAIARGRLASSFLFAGPRGIGKHTFARKLAQALLCQSNPEAELDPCGVCPSCKQVEAGAHPDLILIAKPEGKSSIPVELLIGDANHRGQEGLCHDLSLKPVVGGRKIAIIDDADDLNPTGANALLKTLEEPPPRSVLILIGTTPAKQLPTIRSRCQLIRFQPLPPKTVADLLLKNGLAADASEAQRLAQYSGGSVAEAQELADADLWAFRKKLFERLAAPVLDSVEFSKETAAFIDEAGKEASLRRARFRQIAAFAAEFYRQLLRAQSGAAPSADAELQEYVGRALAGGGGDSQRAAARLDRCLELSRQIDRNIYQAILVEGWLDDLARNS